MPDPNLPSQPTYFVIGATGGIGTALCRRLAAKGSRLVLAARDTSRLEALGHELDASVRSFDATDLSAVDRAVDETREEHGRIDGLVSLVGSILLRPAHRTSEEDWNRTLATNLTTAFAAVRSGAAAMQRTGGSIVLMSSAAARLGLPNHDAIAAAKAGVAGLATTAAATYAKRGIRVNVVSPGLVRTPLSEPVIANPASERASLGMHALGRLGEPDDVASAIEWLLDPAQSWVTGQVLGVDGGLGVIRAS